MTSGNPGAGTQRPVDPVAAARTRQRLETAPAPWLHEETARRMSQRLSVLRQPPRQVLDWWPRAGGSAPALSAALPQARIRTQGLPDAASPPTRVWWQRWFGTEARPGAEATAPGSAPAADMVWANMLMHHVADPVALLSQWHAAMNVGGLLMFSTLGPGTLPSLRRLYRDQDWGPAMADWVDMHDIGDMLVEVGFADPVMDQELIRLTWNRAEDALLELRTLGSNLAPSRMPGLRTPRWRNRLLESLARSVGPASQTSARVELEFEVIYGHAFKAQPRLTVAPETHIDLDDMRRRLKQARNDPFP